MRRFIGATFGVLVLVPIELRADDWPQWGGPQRDLVWREKGIVRKLPTEGLLPRLWATPIGEGYSGPAVAAGKVYITDLIDRQDKRGTERVLCLDAATGKVLWTCAYPVEYGISYPAGPRATPVVDGSRVYCVGAVGDLACLSAQDGKVLWKKNFVAEYGHNIPTWGSSASPLADGDQLIMLVGGLQGALIVSFDKTTGRELWRAIDDPEVGYCPPVIFTFGGTRQVIAWHPRAVSSLDPATGKVLWEIPFKIRSGLCISTPRQIGNRLFVTAFYNGPMMIDVGADGRSASIAWQGKSDSEMKTDGLHSIMSTPWVNETHLYGVCSYGQLRCLDSRTGQRLWETRQATGDGRWWNAFLIPNEDRFFIHNEQGDLIIAALSPEGYKEVSRAKLVEPTRKVGARMTIWSHPAFALGSVFARNDREIVRVDLTEK
jgi:outer membrane protein assembly factor BamB